MFLGDGGELVRNGVGEIDFVGAEGEKDGSREVVEKDGAPEGAKPGFSVLDADEAHGDDEPE